MKVSDLTREHLGQRVTWETEADLANGILTYVAHDIHTQFVFVAVGDGTDPETEQGAMLPPTVEVTVDRP